MTDNSAPHMNPQGNPSAFGGANFGVHVWGFFAGIISAVAFVQIFNGGLIGLTLAYVCLLPLYVVGLAGGRSAAVTATVFGILGVLMQTMAGSGFAIATLYAALFGVPAMVISRVSLIRTDGAFVSGSVVLLTMLTLGCVLLLGSAVALGTVSISISDLTRSVADNYAVVMKETQPSLTDTQLAEISTMLAGSLPGLMALSWFIIHLLNYAIGQWVAGQIGKAQRPTPLVSTLALPTYMVPVTILGIVLSTTMEGNTGIVMGAVSMLLGTGFTLVGLAVMHALLLDFTARRGWSPLQRNALLTFYYVFFLMAQLPLVLALALGLADPWVKTRQKLIKTPIHSL